MIGAVLNMYPQLFCAAVAVNVFRLYGTSFLKISFIMSTLNHTLLMIM